MCALFFLLRNVKQLSHSIDTDLDDKTVRSTMKESEMINLRFVLAWEI